MERPCSGSSINPEDMSTMNQSLRLCNSFEEQRAFDNLASSFSGLKERDYMPPQSGSDLKSVVRETNNLQENSHPVDFQLFEASNDFDDDFSKKAQNFPFYQAYNTNGLFGIEQTPPSSGTLNYNIGTSYDAFLIDSTFIPYNREDANSQSQIGYNFSNSGFQLDASYLDYLNTPVFFGAGPPPPTPATPFLLSDSAFRKHIHSQVASASTPTSALIPFGIEQLSLDSFLPPPALPSQGNSFDSSLHTYALSLGMNFDANHLETNIDACSSSRSFNTFSLHSNAMWDQKSEPVDFSSDTKVLSYPEVGESLINLATQAASENTPQHFQDFGQLSFGASAETSSTGFPQRLKRVPSNPKASSQYDELKAGNRLKRPKQKNVVRELLPLLQGQTIIAPKPKTPEPQLSETNVPKPSFRLSNLSPNAIVELKTKSNYQLLREGKTQVLGLDFSDGLSFDRRRIAHKDAERIRRKQQGEQFHVLQKALHGLSEKASKIDVLCLAQETVSSNASAIESQADQIKEILSKFCPQGVQLDFPPELIKWMNPSGG